MVKKPSLVSVIIPVFNSERFIQESLESVGLQDYSPIEVIAVDDGSTDKSATLIRSFEGIRYFHQSHSGVAAARNLGISKASGCFLAFLDSDDIWGKEKTSKQASVLMNNPELDCVFSKFENFFDPESKLPPWMDRNHFASEKFQSMQNLNTMLIRREAFQRVGLFDTQYRSGEDIEWFTRMKDTGIQYSSISEILVFRRLHDSNLSYKQLFKQQDLLEICKASIDRKRLKNLKNQEKA